MMCMLLLLSMDKNKLYILYFDRVYFHNMCYVFSGSVERMMAILIEHTGGKWPFWLSPRQVLVIPVSQEHESYASSVVETFKKNGLLADMDASSNTLNKRIRSGQLSQYNYILGMHRYITSTFICSITLFVYYIRFSPVFTVVAL